MAKKRTYLDFEESLRNLDHQREELIDRQNEGKDVDKELAQLDKQIDQMQKAIFDHLSPWQRVQLSRHPDRPKTLEYAKNLFQDFCELHGDRQFGDDKAMVGGFALLDGDPVMVIGQEKGSNTKERQYHNFGMAKPEGYRKAMRLMKLAEKFNRPIITLIDTPGAYPGIGAEERGQAESIAKNLQEMLNLSVPIISIIIGEGASGGAIGIGVGDRIMMLENTWFTVISPESCSTILWRSAEHKEKAAEALKLTAHDMQRLKIVDTIIKEGPSGAHRNREATFKNVKRQIKRCLNQLREMTPEERKMHRYAKYEAIGSFIEVETTGSAEANA